MPRLRTLPDWYLDALSSVDNEIISYAELLFDSIQMFLEYTDAIPLEVMEPTHNNFGVTRRLVSQNEQTLIVLRYIHYYLHLKDTYNVDFPTVPLF